MLLGLPIFHILVFFVLLVSIAFPFLLITHMRHARALMALTMLLTISGFVLFLLFGRAPDRSDLVLLRSYAFSSALSSLADKLSSLARDEKTFTRRRFIVLLPLGIVFLLTLACLLGGISGTF